MGGSYFKIDHLHTNSYKILLVLLSASSPFHENFVAKPPDHNVGMADSMNSTSQTQI